MNTFDGLFFKQRFLSQTELLIRCMFEVLLLDWCSCASECSLYLVREGMVFRMIREEYNGQ